MGKKSITVKTARRFLVAYHGLDRYPGTGKERTILDYFHKVGSVQFDPLDICGRNAELVLQARVKDFRPADLEKLLYGKRKLTEGWDKMMCIYNMHEYPHFKRRRERDLAFYRSDRCSEIRKIAGKIRNEIEKSGPLSSLDLDFEGKIDWAWAPAKLSKAALEILFYSGQLAIHNRSRSRRIYDLSENIIPRQYLNLPDPHDREADHTDWRVLRRLRGLGLYYDRSGDGWLGMEKKKQRDPSLHRLAERGDIIPLEIEGLPWNFYIPASESSLLEDLEKGKRKISRNIRFLAPLDNFMWDRFLIEQLFDFQYRWEVYKPVSQREYGYYVLPVLYGDRIIARFEPVRNRETSQITVKNWWWEENADRRETVMKAIGRSLDEFADFLQCRMDREGALRLIARS